MQKLLFFGLYFLPGTQCMMEKFLGTKGMNIASNQESRATLATHSGELQNIMESRSEFVQSTTHVHSKEEKEFLEFIENIPQLRLSSQVGEQGGNLAINQVADPNSSKGRKTLIKLLLQDLNSLSIDSKELGWIVVGVDDNIPLLEALEEVDKLLLAHIKHRLSVLTLSGKMEIPSSKTKFPALRMLDHGNILRNIYFPQNKVAVPTGQMVKKVFKVFSRGSPKICGRMNFEDVLPHCKSTKLLTNKMHKFQSPPFLEEIMTHKDNCQCPMRQASMGLARKMLTMDEKLNSIKDPEEKIRFKMVYFKALNFMYRHELISVQNVQSLFEQKNLEYAASHMTSLNNMNHIKSSYNAGKFWYPTVTEGVYNCWYTSDFMNFFTVLQKEQKDYFSYYLIFLKARNYLYRLPEDFEKGRFQISVNSFFSSFLSMNPDQYYKERKNLLENLQPKI
ncbi:hypothetical protein PtA15_5A765 [Puccinia triticina]|uniref:Uncharacterized protein n=1 Tax=Puccinia triticina TaxID=208348 RepID=A0ABY7CIY9_9BASI|nr:uncharacterized protein PtA15_5A765 [Puccinia triticina]WAQ85191.1 hypothetical protein PtA15_5A765 [Puccinia triticina]